MRVLIAAHTGIGNFILKIPMINKIKKLFPDSQVDVITGTSKIGNIFSIAETIDTVDNVYQLSQNGSLFEKVRFFKNLRKQGYNAIFLPFDSKPRFLTLCSYLAKIPLRVIHEQITLHNSKSTLKCSVKLCLYPKTLYVPLLQGRHEIDLNYDLLEAFINAPFEREYSTPLPYDGSPSLLRSLILDNNEYIVIQLSARDGYPTPKTWNPDNFRELIRKLHDQYPDNPIVTVGSEKEYETSIKDFVKEFPYLINTAGKTSLIDVIGVIANAKLVIAHDSGLMHITNAVNTPLIALYGPTDYTRTRPLGENSHIIFSKNQYFGNMYNFKITEEELAQSTANYECMNGISVDDVLGKIRSLFVNNGLESSGT